MHSAERRAYSSGRRPLPVWPGGSFDRSDDWLDPTPNASYPLMVGRAIATVANNNDRNARGPHDRGSDRTQMHPGVPAAAVASQDHKLGILGLVDQPAVRDVADQSS